MRVIVWLSLPGGAPTAVARLASALETLTVDELETVGRAAAILERASAAI